MTQAPSSSTSGKLQDKPPESLRFPTPTRLIKALEKSLKAKPKRFYTYCELSSYQCFFGDTLLFSYWNTTQDSLHGRMLAMLVCNTSNNYWTIEIRQRETHHTILVSIGKPRRPAEKQGQRCLKLLALGWLDIPKAFSLAEAEDCHLKPQNQLGFPRFFQWNSFDLANSPQKCIKCTGT